ncbi:ASPH [Symbiodinium sp. CCMP2592]|nr:ASPH [Symbiodinium sp. CCMP2592]
MLPQEPPGPPPRSATHRPRGGKANRRKIRREARIAQELARLNVPLLVDLQEDEEETAGVGAASVRSSASSASAAALAPPVEAESEPERFQVAFTQVRSLLDLEPPGEVFGVLPLRDVCNFAGDKDRLIFSGGDIQGEGSHWDDQQVRDFRAFIAGAVSVDYYRTLSVPQKNASRGDIPGTERTVIPVENLQFLATLTSKGYKSVLLSFVGARSCDAYVEDLLRSGVCNLFTCALVVTKKTGWRGKSHYFADLQLKHHFDDAEEIIKEFRQWGQPISEVSRQKPLSSYTGVIDDLLCQ